jgi:hypothetical protein
MVGRRFISRPGASRRFSFGSGRVRREPAAGAARLMVDRRFISRPGASRRFSFGSGRIRREPAAGAARLMSARLMTGWRCRTYSRRTDVGILSRVSVAAGPGAMEKQKRAGFRVPPRESRPHRPPVARRRRLVPVTLSRTRSIGKSPVGA